jgi:hypothetical protein
MSPNAAKTKIYFSNIANNSIKIHIFKEWRTHVFHRAIITKNSIDMCSFNAGNYIVKRATDKKSKKQKLVIQHYL